MQIHRSGKLMNRLGIIGTNQPSIQSYSIKWHLTSLTLTLLLIRLLIFTFVHQVSAVTDIRT